MSLNPINIIIKATDQASQALRAPIKSFKDMRVAAVAMGPAVGTALAAAGTAFAFMAKGVINANDEMAKMSQRTGFTTESLSALKYGAELSGTSIEGLEKGLKKLSVNILDAERGTKEAKDTFSALGISYKTATGEIKSGDAVLSEVAERFKTMPDGIEKSAIAQKMFGKSGAELIPMLNGGAAGLAAFRKEAEELGIIVSGDTAAAAEQFNDNLSRLHSAVTGVVQTIVAEALPQFVSLTNTLIQMAKKFLENRDNIKMVGDGLVVLAKIAVSVAQVMFSAFKLVGQTLADLALAAVQFYSGDFKGALQTYKDMFKNIKDVTIDGIGNIKDTWTSAGAEIAKKPIIPPETVETLNTTATVIKDKVQDTFSSAATSMTTAMLIGTGGAKQALLSFFQSSIDATVKWAIAQMGILKLVSSAFAYLKTNPVLAAVGIGGLIAAARGLQASLKPDTGLAQGGIVTRPTVAMVGEAGPEAVLPLNQQGFGQSEINVFLDGRAILSYIGGSINTGRLNLRTGAVQ